MSAPDLNSRIALITGAAGGIGQALARALVDAAMRVALCDTSKSVTYTQQTLPTTPYV
jgi:NAD(P)-dependent dehydrogenase (short-subunit alcohol dehydrogenase family)